MSEIENMKNYFIQTTIRINNNVSLVCVSFRYVSQFNLIHHASLLHVEENHSFWI